MMKAGVEGHRMLQEAHDEYKQKAASLPKASGVILHRKDQMVVDGKFKWIPCIWKIEGSNLTLAPIGSIPQEAEAFRINSSTQYKKPKSKHYPLQFGTSTVYTSALLETVTYGATGYANSPLDPLNQLGTNAVEGMGKIAALEMADLEKVLFCIQAVVEGKPAGTYLPS